MYCFSTPQPLFLSRLHDTGAGICYFISFASWNNFSLTTEDWDWYCKTPEIERHLFLHPSLSYLFRGGAQRPTSKVQGCGHTFRSTSFTPGRSQPSLPSSFHDDYRGAFSLHSPARTAYEMLWSWRTVQIRFSPLILSNNGRLLLAGFFTSKRLYIAVVYPCLLQRGQHLALCVLTPYLLPGPFFLT